MDIVIGIPEEFSFAFFKQYDGIDPGKGLVGKRKSLLAHPLADTGILPDHQFGRIAGGPLAREVIRRFLNFHIT